jgi:hypothetical protein
MHFSALYLLPLAGLSHVTAIPTADRSQPVPRHLITENGGVIIPEGPDGVFVVTFDPHNSTEATITTLELFQGGAVSKHSDPAPRSAQAKRDLPIAKSGCGRTMQVPADYDQATRALGRQCDHGMTIPYGEGKAGLLYTRVGNSIAYGCTWGGTNPCSSNEFYQSDVFLDNKCGQYWGGWIWMEDWLKGYGRILAGEEACSQVIP